MTRRTVLAALCGSIVTLAVPVTLPAAPLESTPALAPGQKLRVTLPGRKEVDTLFGRSIRREEGVLLQISRNRLGLESREVPGDTLWIGKASIVKLEMSYGSEGHPWRGAAYGAVIGVIGGLIAAAIETESCQGEFLCGVGYVYFPPLGAAGGLFIGAIVGGIIKTERWVEVPESDYDIGFRFPADPGDPRAEVALRTRF